MHKLLFELEEICLYCLNRKDQKMELINLIRVSNPFLCYYCDKSFKKIKRKINIFNYPCLIFFEYNQFFEQFIYTYKESYHSKLALVLAYYLQEIKFEKYQVVIVPSSLEKTKKRAFHSLKLIFEFLNIEVLDIFEKDDFNQKNQKNRNLIHQHIKLKSKVNFTQSKILLVDDILVSGNSVKSCLDLLKDYNLEIKLLIIASNLKNY